MRIVKSIGYQSFTSNTLASVTPTSTELLKDNAGNKANAMLMTAAGSSGAVRFTDNGTAPSATLGLRLAVGLSPYLYLGNAFNTQFIIEAGNASLDVAYVQVAD